MTWTIGDVSGSETLADTDHLYPSHINEVRVYLGSLNSKTETLSNKTITAPVINGAITGDAISTGTTVNTGTANDEIVTPKAIADSYLSNVYNSLYRQALINGNFDVWQRGTSTTSLASYDLADRWEMNVTLDGGTLPTTITRSRQALTPGDIFGAFYYYRFAPDGAGSGFGTGYKYGLGQKIEYGTRFLCGASKSITVSFWARSSVGSKKVGLFLTQNYGTTGSPTAEENIAGDNFTLTSSWQKFTKTITTNTLVGKTFGTDGNDYLRPVFLLAWGTGTYATLVNSAGVAENLANGTIDIAQVQLCAGDVALPFVPKSFEDELRACQRYYEKSYDYANAPGTATVTGSYMFNSGTNNNNYRQVAVQFSVKKRITAPTVTLYDMLGTSGKIATVDEGTSETNNVTDSADNPSQGNFLVSNNTAAEAGLRFHWTADAEL
jgi:hypothetical protein